MQQMKKENDTDEVQNINKKIFFLLIAKRQKSLRCFNDVRWKKNIWDLNSNIKKRQPKCIKRRNRNDSV